jgi:D-alanine-D-alanine ligase-like ATP-grasp enzyme
VFKSPKQALAYGNQLGFPLVVKPRSGSLSKHVTVDIKTLRALEKAITKAQKYSPEFLVERHLPGQLFRATVVGRSRVFVCKKVPANVTGNGKDTVKTLIKTKNADPNRGGADANTTLHEIAITRAKQFLANSNMSLDDIPESGERVALAEKITLKAGCDVIELTDKVHPHNRQMFQKAAKVLEAGLVGFDFLAEDITTSWKNQPCGLIEANTHPYADMHQHPSSGPAQNIAQAVWDEIE